MRKQQFDKNKNDLDFQVSLEANEDLTSELNSDKYEYIFPNYKINKIMDTDYSGLVEINSFGYNKLYNTNVSESVIINDLNFSSIEKFSDYGFVNDYKFSLKNLNSYANNSQIFKTSYRIYISVKNR